MAAAPAVPLPVSVPVNDGPTVNGSRFLRLPAAESIVVNTSFLGWLPATASAAGPQVELAEWQLLDAFAGKARPAPDAASKAAAATRNLFTTQLTSAFWSKYLTELKASGLLAKPLVCRKSLHARLKELTPVTPANLQVNASDWSAAESFDTPAVAAIPAIAGRAARGGRRAVAAAPAVPGSLAVPGPAELKFIAMADLSLLESSNGAAPWAEVARGAGMLGPACTRTIRLDDTSALRRVAAPLRAAVARHLGVNPTPAYDATLAGFLGGFLRTAVVSDGLEAHGVTSPELIAEAMDSFRAQRSAGERLAVEEARFHLQWMVPESSPSDPYSLPLLSTGKPPPLFEEEMQEGTGRRKHGAAPGRHRRGRRGRSRSPRGLPHESAPPREECARLLRPLLLSALVQPACFPYSAGSSQSLPAAQGLSWPLLQ